MPRANMTCTKCPEQAQLVKSAGGITRRPDTLLGSTGFSHSPRVDIYLCPNQHRHEVQR